MCETKYRSINPDDYKFKEQFFGFVEAMVGVRRNWKYSIVSTYFLFYKKPSSRPSTKSFLIFGHILVLKVP